MLNFLVGNFTQAELTTELDQLRKVRLYAVPQYGVNMLCLDLP